MRCNQEDRVGRKGAAFFRTFPFMAMDVCCLLNTLMCQTTPGKVMAVTDWGINFFFEIN